MQDDKKRLQIKDESLTPDEAHKIEVRVDKMLKVDEPTESGVKPSAPALPDSSDKPKAVDETPVAAEPESVAEPEQATQEPDEPVEATESAVGPVAAEPDASTSDEQPDEIALLASEDTLTDKAQSTDEQKVPSTSKAIDHDEALVQQNEALASAFGAAKPQKSSKFKRLLSAWWHSRRARWLTLAGLVIVLGVLAAWPVSRSWALNSTGVRATAKVTVLDASTKLPLKNVNVRFGQAHAVTNDLGTATVTGVRLGKQTLHVQKTAFATTDQIVQISLGSNTLAPVLFRAVGTQYHLLVLDYTTGQPITSAQASSGSAAAVADKKGLITLTANSSADTLSINVAASGYRPKTVKQSVGATKQLTVQLAIARYEVYFSKQSGKYDLYKSDIDGQHKQVVLPATGKETDALGLLPHPTAEEAAIVTTRDGVRDSDGYQLQGLALVNLNTGSDTTIDHSERIVPIDWIGDRLVYAIAKAGASAANPGRYQLLSYDYRTNQRLELDHANSFNDVVSANGAIYYATSNQYNGGVSQFAKINADGTGKQVLLATDVWNILRTDYDNFFLNTGDSDYTYKVGAAKPVATTDHSLPNSRLYIDSPDGKHSLWVDQRDGKGAIIIHDIAKNTDTVLAEQAGISYPVRWLSNDSLVYRVSTQSETADYTIGVASNTAKKITDVTNAAGRALWYFY